ncbi:MAG: hypothetical protein OXL97_11755 [Chloroflexota bacterium]|nr:hypothetical protein [Chloroflexota bacterium]MDE2884647.1 hypothetical protein [Chloroflexota bacterium]
MGIHNIDGSVMPTPPRSHEVVIEGTEPCIVVHCLGCMFVRSADDADHAGAIAQLHEATFKERTL